MHSNACNLEIVSPPPKKKKVVQYTPENLEWNPSENLYTFFYLAEGCFLMKKMRETQV